MSFTKHVLRIECAAETERICNFIRQQLLRLKRQGVVIGLSGGIDSALSAALCVKALGKAKVFGLMLPDRESSPQSEEFAVKHARQLDIVAEVFPITPVLEAFGTYDKRDAVARSIFPEFSKDHKLKITLPSDILNKESFNFFTLTVVDPQGQVKTARLSSPQAKGIIAATCTKHRVRMMTQ